MAYALCAVYANQEISLACIMKDVWYFECINTYELAELYDIIYTFLLIYLLIQFGHTNRSYISHSRVAYTNRSYQIFHTYRLPKITHINRSYRSPIYFAQTNRPYQSFMQTTHTNRSYTSFIHSTQVFRPYIFPAKITIHLAHVCHSHSSLKCLP